MRRAAVLGVITALGVGTLTLPARAATVTAGPSPRIFVVTSGSQSVEDAIADRAAVDSSYRVAARRIGTQWASRLGRGLRVPGLAGATPTQQRASVNTLNRELATGRPAATAGNSTVVIGSGGVGVSARMVVPLINGHDPNSFPVRGNPGSGRTYWTGMQLIVAARFCGPDGCSSDTDRFTSNVTINPGAVTSRVNGRNLYFPDSGNFGNKHFEMFAINRGNIVGDANTGNLPASSQDYVSSSRALNGTVLTVAITLWVYLNPYGSYYADGAKTHDCTCHPKPDNACTY